MAPATTVSANRPGAVADADRHRSIPALDDPADQGAILNCERLQVTDPKIVGLCGHIVKAPVEEIAG